MTKNVCSLTAVCRKRGINILLTIAIMMSATPVYPKPDDATVYIQAGYEKDGIFKVLDQGTGFIVNSSGWIITAKHLLDITVPPDYKKEFRGAIKSNTNSLVPMFAVPGSVVSSDVGLLMFSPQLGQKWPYLKVLPDGRIDTTNKIEAWGFPAGEEMAYRPGDITSLNGPNASVQVNAGFREGMSGGPVLLAGTRCVIGIVAGGPNYPTYEYFIPIRYVRPLLDEAQAEIISVDNVNSGCNQDTIPGQYDYLHPLVKIKTVGEMSWIDVSFSVPDSNFPTKPNLITVYTYRLSGGTRNGEANFPPETGQWSPGDVAKVNVSIPTSYFNDADRYLHYCIGTVLGCLPGPDLLHYQPVVRE
jgi:hypothetical protein